MIAAARTSMGFQFQSVAASAPLMAPELGLDNAQLGLLVGLYLLPGVALALPGGIIGQRFGDKRVVLAGLAMMAAGSLLIGLAPDYATALAGRLLSGVGAVLLNVLLSKMVADWFAGREIVLAMSIFINTWPIGIALALFALPALAQLGSWPLAFHGGAAVAAVACLGFAALYAAPPGAAAAAGQGVGLGVLTRREVHLTCLAAAGWMLFNAAYAVMLAFLPLHLTTVGMSAGQTAFWMGLNTVLAIVSVQIGGVLAQRSRHRLAFSAVGLIAFGLMLVSLPALADPRAVLVLGGLLFALPAGVLVAQPAQILRPQSRGPGMGLFYTWFYAGMATLPPLAGLAADFYGGTAAALVLAGLVAFAVLPLLILVERLKAAPRPAAIGRAAAR